MTKNKERIAELEARVADLEVDNALLKRANLSWRRTVGKQDEAYKALVSLVRTYANTVRDNGLLNLVERCDT